MRLALYLSRNSPTDFADEPKFLSLVWTTLRDLSQGTFLLVQKSFQRTQPISQTVNFFKQIKDKR